MGVELRQVVAGVLTLTMFVMLGNMIKRDHFDSVEVKAQPPHTSSSISLSLSLLYLIQSYLIVFCIELHLICFTFHFKAYIPVTSCDMCCN
jgi:F0F1-type ATP synthase membrane subunit a